MSKDYAKLRESRRRGRPANNTRKKTDFTWLVIGIVIGIIIAGLGFLKHQVAATVHPDKKLIIDEFNKGKTPRPARTKTGEPDEEKVNFDFYTILPDSRVKASVKDRPADRLKEFSPDDEQNLSSDKKSDSLAVRTPVTSKEMQHREQNLLSPTTSVTVNDSSLKPISVEPAPKKALPAAKTATNPPARRTDDTSKAMTESVAKKQATQAARLAHLRDMEGLSERLAHEDQTTGVPVVDLTATNTPYIVQIASFKHFQDADRLKGQLTLTGYEAKVKTVVVKGVTWHRVWIGPYATATAAEKLQKELLARHTRSVVVRIK